MGKAEPRVEIADGGLFVDEKRAAPLFASLVHLVRNAIDHGIEPSEQRKRVGKPLAGTIALNAFQKGNHVMIEIEDDGKVIIASPDAAAARRAIDIIEKTLAVYAEVLSATSRAAS